ncbi:ricin-type beta-trefoil lectin domain protein [Ceratobasidium sp. AG-Ba]|nr:ricin-type beta-trefoil lectin domain protein [Ceratobasidium sp. AG-Ba]
MSSTEFCIRGCKDGGRSRQLCGHIWDEMGCEWNMPGNYKQGEFENCLGDSAQPMGVYGSSTFHQGDPVTPAAHPAPGSSSCKAVSSVGNGALTSSTASVTSTTAPAGGSGSSAATATATSSSNHASRQTLGADGFGFAASVTMITALLGACVAL